MGAPRGNKNAAGKHYMSRPAKQKMTKKKMSQITRHLKVRAIRQTKHPLTDYGHKRLAGALFK